MKRRLNREKEQRMALVSQRRRDDDWGGMRKHRDNDWEDDHWGRDWHDWPQDWPTPRELAKRYFQFWSDSDRGWHDWPRDWPQPDAMMPRFSSHLDRLDRNWRNDPFWKDLYPTWAEPTFKEGLDVKSNIVNDRDRFAVEIDAYQFKPEEIQVKTQDDMVLIEGRHEDTKDRDNFTKMFFIRKYQLPSDVDPMAVTSSINNQGRLTVEAPRRPSAIQSRERVLPIEGSSGNRSGSRAQSRFGESVSPRPRYESGRDNGYRNGYHRHQDNYQSRPVESAPMTLSPRSRADDDDSHGGDTRNERSSSYYHRSERRHYSANGDRNGGVYREYIPPKEYRIDSPRTDYYRNDDNRMDTHRTNGDYRTPSATNGHRAETNGHRSETNGHRSESRNVQVHHTSSKDSRGFRSSDDERRDRADKDRPSTSAMAMSPKKTDLGERTASRSSVHSVQLLRKTEELR